ALEFFLREGAALQFGAEFLELLAVDGGVGRGARIGRGRAPAQQRRQHEEERRRGQHRGEGEEQRHRASPCGLSPGSAGPSTRSTRRFSSGPSWGASGALRRRRSVSRRNPAPAASSANGPIQSRAVVALKGGS